MDSEVKVDRRKRKTKRLLKEALFSLMREKDFNSITVQDITNLCDINRATFYAHYHDKYDLLYKVIEETVQDFGEIFQRYNQDDPNYPHKLHLAIFRHVEERADFYTTIVGKRGSYYVWKKLMDIISQSISNRSLNLQKTKDIPMDIVNSFISSAYIGVIVNWLENGMNHSSEYMAEKLTFLIVNEGHIKPIPL